MTETTDVRPTPAAVFQSIPLDQIRPSSHQHRQDFDEASIRSLADSIEVEGLLQPVTVRSVPGGYELIAGERRLRAVKLLGQPVIEARVIAVASEAASAAKGLVENLQSKDLNPIEEAEGFQELNQLDPKYWDQPQIAKVAGKSQGYISQGLKLLQLPQEVVKSIRALILSRSHGLELLRLPTPEKQSETAKLVLDKKLSWEATRKLVDGMLGKPEKLESQKMAQEPKATLGEFQIAKKGNRLAISGSFPVDSSPDAIRESLNSALSNWPPPTLPVS
jgi:ParB family chromosome partitioning protein